MKVKYGLSILLLFVLLLNLNPENVSMAQEDTTVVDGMGEVRAFDPPLIGYQGRLLENGTPVTGTREMTFKLFHGQEAGNAIWEETKSVVVSNGLFQTNLGDTTPFPFGTINDMDHNLWLEVAVGGNTMPRQLLTGSPYAFSLVPGARITGDTDDFILQAINQNSTGLFGSSRWGTGVFGESFGQDSTGTGVHGVSEAGAGVFAGSRSDGENPAPALQAHAFGTGPILAGMGGTDQDVDFIVENDGSVKQSLEANGLVKVGLHFFCGSEEYDEIGNFVDDGVNLISSFNNVGGEITLSAGTEEGGGQCTIGFDFDLTGRFWIAQNPEPDFSDPVLVHCKKISTTELLCVRNYISGVNPGEIAVGAGEIMLMLY